jgi:hypothetical protein
MDKQMPHPPAFAATHAGRIEKFQITANME